MIFKKLRAFFSPGDDGPQYEITGYQPIAKGPAGPPPTFESGIEPAPAQHPRTEIKRGDYEICLILKTLEAILANLQDVNASLASLNSEVQLAIQKIGGSAASAADLDAVKAGIDAATSALQSALNPPPAV